MPNHHPPSNSLINRRFSVAPMMDYTDRHCRYFHRLLSQHTLLYTEMVTTGALIHGDVERHLYRHPDENPVALQLGGAEPSILAQCANLAAKAGFQEINLNCGCPSDRVVSGMFGAILMKNPALVADCFKAMQDVSDVPITIKHRTGVDEFDSFGYLCDFVGHIAEAGCKTFIVHARKAWLKGLSPKQNREIPPLQYDRVYLLKKTFPSLEIIINGGVKTIDQAKQHLHYVDGVMMGREAYHNPYILAEIDSQLFGDNSAIPGRVEIVRNFQSYMDQQISTGVPAGHMTRHILGLFQGIPGARKFRRHISENVHRKDTTPEIVQDALLAMN